MEQGSEAGDAKLLIFWSGRRGSNPRRPACEISSVLKIKTLASKASTEGDQSTPCFQSLAPWLLLMELKLIAVGNGGPGTGRSAKITNPFISLPFWACAPGRSTPGSGTKTTALSESIDIVQTKRTESAFTSDPRHHPAKPPSRAQHGSPELGHRVALYARVARCSRRRFAVARPAGLHLAPFGILLQGRPRDVSRRLQTALAGS